jgi:carboxymethylenebutenolidase
VVVFHEVWGLAEHTREVCKRLGKLGFAAVAPDLYEGYGKLLAPDNIRKAMEVVWDLSLEERRDRSKLSGTLAMKKPTREVAEAVTTLYDQGFREHVIATATEVVDDAKAKFGGVSTLGFSFGGGVSLRVGARTQGLNSTIAFYGEPPGKDDLRRITSPILAIYAGEDEFMNRNIPYFIEAAKESGSDLTLKIMPGAKHGFFDDTNRAAFNKEAAAEAWRITTQFLERTLGRPRARPSKE